MFYLKKPVLKVKGTHMVKKVLASGIIRLSYLKQPVLHVLKIASDVTATVLTAVKGNQKIRSTLCASKQLENKGQKTGPGIMREVDMRRGVRIGRDIEMYCTVYMDGVSSSLVSLIVIVKLSSSVLLS